MSLPPWVLPALVFFLLCSVGSLISGLSEIAQILRELVDLVRNIEGRQTEEILHSIRTDVDEMARQARKRVY